MSSSDNSSGDDNSSGNYNEGEQGGYEEDSRDYDNVQVEDQDDGYEYDPAPPPPARGDGRETKKYSNIVAKLTQKIKEQPEGEEEQSEDEYDYDIDPAPENDITPDLPDPPTSDEDDYQPAPDSSSHSSVKQKKKKKRAVGEKEVAGTMVKYFSEYPIHVLASFFGGISFIFCNVFLFLALFLLQSASLGCSIWMLVYVTIDMVHYWDHSCFTVVALVFMLLAGIPLSAAFICGFLQVFFSFLRLHFIVPTFSQMYICNLGCYCCFNCMTLFVLFVGFIVWCAAYTSGGEQDGTLAGMIINEVVLFIFMLNMLIISICCVCPCCIGSFCISQGTSQVSQMFQIFGKKEVVKMDMEERSINEV